MNGAKYDSGKLAWILFPFSILNGVVQVLMFGARKYKAFSWQTVPCGRERYLSAASRHLALYLGGEEFDQESGLPHLDHIICNYIFARSDHWNKETTLPDLEKFGDLLKLEAESGNIPNSREKAHFVRQEPDLMDLVKDKIQIC